jgi:hypothetical protein
MRIVPGTNANVANAAMNDAARVFTSWVLQLILNRARASDDAEFSQNL